MGIFTRRNQASTPEPALNTFTDKTTGAFSVVVDPALFGLSSTDGLGGISRREALSVPALKRARDILCTSIGTLPLDLHGPDKSTSEWPLFVQPEKYIPRSVTFTRTAEDLFFEGVAYWRVTEYQWNSYPKHVKRIDPSRVQIDEDREEIYIDGKPVNPNTIIAFPSANPGILESGARAIRTSLALDKASAKSAAGVPPMGILRAEDGTTITPDDVPEIRAAWDEALRNSGTLVLSGISYTPISWDPEKLQLADARQHAALEIARLTGIDPEELGVSTTSRTYANQFDRRKAFLDFTQAAYRIPMEERLSMGDCSPRGFYARFNLSAFLRSDDLTRQQVYGLALENGSLTREEVRDLEDRPALKELAE